MSKAVRMAILMVTVFFWLLIAAPILEREIESQVVEQIAVIGGGAAAILLAWSAILLITHLSSRSRPPA